jgi:hypothetical protein
MKNKILLAISLLSVLVSCKNEKSVKTEPEEVKKESFKISLGLIVPKDDSLQIFYTEADKAEYKEENSVWAIVKGSEKEQEATFELPSDVIPSELRIDFGQNKDQKQISVKNFKMEYLGKKFEVRDTLFYQYFQPVNQIDWDRKNAIAKINTPEGQKHDPSFNPRETLKTEINNLIK